MTDPIQREEQLPLISMPTTNKKVYEPLEATRFFVSIVQPKPDEKLGLIGVHENSYRYALQKYPNIDETYLSDDPNKADDTKSFDTIICNPGFYEIKVRNSDQESLSKIPGDKWWLDWSLKHLKSAGRIVIVVSIGLLSNQESEELREYLVQSRQIRAIIKVHSGWGKTGSKAAGIILLGYWPEQSEPGIKMIDFSDNEANIPWDTLSDYIFSPDYSKDFSQVKLIQPDQISEDYRLDPNFYLNRIEVNGLDKLKKLNLEDIVEINGGQHLGKDISSVGEVYFVQAGDIDVQGKLNLIEDNKVPYSKVRTKSGFRSGYSQPGEILITVSGTIGRVLFPLNQIPNEGVFISSSLRRLHSYLDEILPTYLALYLRSSIAQSELSRLASGDSPPSVTSHNLKKLAIYIPTIHVQQKLIAISSEFDHTLSPEQITELITTGTVSESLTIQGDTP